MRAAQVVHDVREHRGDARAGLGARLLRVAERRELTPHEGIARLKEIQSQPPRHGIAVTVLGHVILTIGICLVLQPTGGDVVLAGIFGALVAVLKLPGRRWRSVQMITPVLAAFVVSLLTFVLADQGWAQADLRAMIAPLVTFAAYVGQKVGSVLLGGYLSGFAGGHVLTIVAYAVERRPTGPPALVTFLPGFWLLVPGSLGLIGLTEYFAADTAAGIDDFLGAIGAIVAIALGVLWAYPIDHSIRSVSRRATALATR